MHIVDEASEKNWTQDADLKIVSSFQVVIVDVAGHIRVCTWGAAAQI